MGVLENLEAINASEDSEYDVEALKQRCYDAMNDDLAAPQAIAAVFDGIAAANRAHEAGDLSPADAASVVGLLERADRVLGLGLERTIEVSDAVQQLLEARAAARTSKDWA